MVEISVLLAVHNRLADTVQAIRALKVASMKINCRVSVWVFDDGSTDGTSEFLKTFKDLEINVVAGTGHDYWAKSMSILERLALEKKIEKSVGEYFLLWLNNDVKISETALRSAITLSLEKKAVIVGQTVDPETGAITYGGLVRTGLNPISFKQIGLVSNPVQVDSFNGNFVLVPRLIAEELGGIDGNFSHGYADIEYGLRLKAAGLSAFVLPGEVGYCARNPESSVEGALTRWKSFIGVKGGGNPASLARILRTVSPRLWRVYFFGTYILWWFRLLKRRVSLNSRRDVRTKSGGWN